MYESVRKSRISTKCSDQKGCKVDMKPPYEVQSRYRFQPVYDNPESYLARKRLRDEEEEIRKLSLKGPDSGVFQEDSGSTSTEAEDPAKSLKDLKDTVNSESIGTEKAVREILAGILDVLGKFDA